MDQSKILLQFFVMIVIVKALYIMLYSLPNNYTNIIMNILQALSIFLLKYMHHKNILCIISNILQRIINIYVTLKSMGRHLSENMKYSTEKPTGSKVYT